jgi:hypothetical protein
VPANRTNTMTTKPKSLPGRKSMFRGKRRAPVSLTLTPAHHRKIQQNLARVPGCTRADFFGLLIEKYAHLVRPDTPTVKGFAYSRLRLAVEALGGTLEHRKRNKPRGGTWVLALGKKCLPIPSEQAMRFPDLDACYRLKPGIVSSRTWKDHTDEIDPVGLAKLFARLAEGEDCA